MGRGGGGRGRWEGEEVRLGKRVMPNTPMFSFQSSRPEA